MTVSKFNIIKQCLNCGNLFEANRITTKYCSHTCNRKHYKFKKRLEKKSAVELETLNNKDFRFKRKVADLALIKNKEYLSVAEVALLIGCSKKSVYRMIENHVINAVNFNERLLRVRREDIEKMFNNPKQSKIQKELDIVDLDLNNCYSIYEIMEKYNVTAVGLRAMAKRNKIPKIYNKRFVYYSKSHIDIMFSF